MCFISLSLTLAAVFFGGNEKLKHIGHRSLPSASVRTFKQQVSRGAEHCKRLGTANSRKLIEESVHSLVVLQKLEQAFDRNTRPRKHFDPFPITFNKLFHHHRTVRNSGI